MAAAVDYNKPEPKHEEAKRFIMPRSKLLYSEKQVKQSQRIYGKKEES